MKKLLIAMTAVAVGTCAWADGDAPTLPELNENFNSDWANGAELEYMTAIPAGKTLWSYSANPIGEGEIKVVTQSEGDNALSLNTGSKVLTGSFASNKNPVDIGTDGLYFKSTVTFKDPSDTLPTLGAQDKFALVVLDNVESCETYNTEENPVVTPATNLWVIAKYGDVVGVKRAYKLKIPVTGKKPEQDENGGDVLTNLDKAWLDVPHEIVVKAYGNVMADSQTPRAGFMVMVDGYICTVDCSCAIEGEGAGVINPTQAGAPVYADDVYLGFAKDAINGTLKPRYNKNQLLLSMTDNNAELTSVDFQGQGVIDNVSLATTGADFGPDATVLTFVGYDATKIASITVGEKAAVNGEYTITGSETADEEGKVTIVVTVNEGYALKGEGWTKNGLTYTYAGYTLPTASAAITLNVFPPAAYVDDEACETVQAALTYIAENGGTGTVVLNNNVKLYDDDYDGYGLTISAGEITIDLNGKTIQAGVNEEDNSTCSTISVSGGKLIVKDSMGGGAILAAAEEYYAIDTSTGTGLTEIQAGTIGKINGSAETLTLVGGSYTDATVKVDDEDTFAYAGSVADGFDATLTGGIWTVAEKQIVNYTVTFNVDGNTTAIAAQTVAENGTATEPADDPTKNGYTFAGWKLNDAAYDFATAVTGDITLVATWTLVEYAITYAWNGLEAGATPVNSNPAKYTIEDGITFTAATCDGYTFKGFSPATITVGSTGNKTVTGTFEKNAPAVTPVEPGAATGTEYDSEDAANAAAAKTEVKVPAEVAAIEGFDSDAYKALFKVTTKQAGNKWVVSVELTETATATLQEAVETAVKALPVAQVAALTTGGAAEVGVEATPGLYYSVESGTSLGDMVEGDRTLATGSTVNLELKKQGNSGFYRIKVSVKGK